MTTVTDLNAELAKIFERRGGRPAGALLTWAEGGGVFLAGVARFLDSKQAARATLDYGNVQLREVWLPLKSAIARLQAILFVTKPKAKAFSFGKFSHVSLERRTTDAFENLTGWPEWLFTARLDGNNVQAANGPAVTHGLPPFDSVHRAIEDWLFGAMQPQGGEARHIRELNIVVPDTRGLLASVTWEGNSLSGTVHTRRSYAELELQVALDTDEGRTLLKPLRPPGSAFIWTTPENARWADVFLVHSSRDVMGRSRLSPGAKVTSDGALPLAEQAASDLANGENDRVEYKPFVERGDKKWWEVAESVVAFANTYGGRLYVGVTNGGIAEGEPALQKVLNKSDEKVTIEGYVAYIDEQIRTRVKPVPPFRLDLAHSLGQRFIAISVSHGNDGPYSTANHEVFIRKAASNKRPDPKTEMPRLYPASADGSPFRNGDFS
jgi:hypothetical protein